MRGVSAGSPPEGLHLVARSGKLNIATEPSQRLRKRLKTTKIARRTSRSKGRRTIKRLSDGSRGLRARELVETFREVV